MSVVLLLLLLLLLSAVAFGSAATRWKHEALEQRGELEAAKRNALEKEAEAVKTREVAEVQFGSLRRRSSS